MTRSIEQMWARPGFVARFPVYMLYDRTLSGSTWSGLNLAGWCSRSGYGSGPARTWARWSGLG